MKTLEKILEKFSLIEFNNNNYSVGGGLTGSGKFASNRHEDANNDEGKLTLGKATQMFCKATGLETEFVKEILQYAVPNMEWHHAGKLPKQYGGGMKKTYFLNAKEIVEVATNFQSYINKLEISKEVAISVETEKKELQLKKNEFLKINAQAISRTQIRFENFIITDFEMEGKFGWFKANTKYDLPIYQSGFKFFKKEDYEKYINLDLKITKKMRLNFTLRTKKAEKEKAEKEKAKLALELKLENERLIKAEIYAKQIADSEEKIRIERELKEKNLPFLQKSIEDKKYIILEKYSDLLNGLNCDTTKIAGYIQYNFQEMYYDLINIVGEFEGISKKSTIRSIYNMLFAKETTLTIS